MLNKSERQLLNVYHSLVRDVMDMHSGGFDLLRDFERVKRASYRIGFREVFLMRLPKLCQEVEKLLEQYPFASLEELKCDGALEVLNFDGSVLYSPLLEMIWSSDRGNRSDTLALRNLRQLLRVFKKLRVGCLPEKTMEKIHEFEQIERELPHPIGNWGSDLFHFNGRYPSLVELGTVRDDQDSLATAAACGTSESILRRSLAGIQFVSDKIARSFRIDWEQFRPKHGPGAVSEKFGESKFTFPSWDDKLDAEFPFSKWGLVNELFYELEHLEAKTRNSPCKLIAVPKDGRGPRLIASEPVSSQYIQQGILGAMRKCLNKTPLKHSYNPLSQEESQLGALDGSLDRSTSTIDLSSASDRLSCAVVECLFRTNPRLLRQLNAARTHEVLMHDGSLIPMRKFAAQGAAFTFPIQSLSYALICIGVIYASRLNNLTRISDCARMVRVFGDDIIVPSEYFALIRDALSALYLKVNSEKSFSNGFFRESCGMDAFRGDDVSTVSIHETFKRASPNTLVAVVEIGNNLYLKGYLRASATLHSTIDKDLRVNIPYGVPGDRSAPLVAYGSGESGLRKRWNSHWQIPERRVLTVEGKITRTRPTGYHSLFQWFVEEPRPDVVWFSGSMKRLKARYRLRWVRAERPGC